MLTGLLSIQFHVVYIPYQRPLPAYLVIFDETSCLFMHLILAALVAKLQKYNIA